MRHHRKTTRGSRRIGLTALITAAVIAIAPTATAYGSARPDPQPARPSIPVAPAVHQVKELAPRFAPKADDKAARNYAAPKAAWPQAASESLNLRATAGAVKGRTTPVSVRSGDSRSAAAVTDVDVVVADQAKARAAGVSGIVFSVTGRGAERAPVQVGLDYSGFAEAYGGNYASRLRLVALPGCALITPELPECRVVTPLKSSNDLRGKTVTADLTLGTADGTMLLAASTSDPGADGGDGGTYAATELKPSGTWASGTSTGSFTYNHPIELPPAPSSLAPQLALAYDSGSVDGQTASTQAQASWAGIGWSTPSSYIEQSFTTCSDKPEGIVSPVSTSDMCYNGPILTMSLNGSSSSLIWDSAKALWKPSTDDGSIVTKVMNSNNGSGTRFTDYWVVKDREGTSYYFGRNQLPGWVAGKSRTNSVDSQPVYSAHSTGPCYNAAGFSSSWCTMAYKWNLDYVVDVHGNAMSYYYQQYTNFYGRNKGATMTSYVRNSHLDHIDYGFTDGNAYGTVPNRVKFNTGERCLVGTCTPLSSTNKANWPDVPFDLVCASGATCTAQGPAFFSTVRLTSIVSQQYSTASSTYQPVDTHALTQTIPPSGDGTSPTLWLASITRTGHDTSAGPGTAITMSPVQFGSVQLQNRVDTVTDGLSAFYKYRIQHVTTEAGSLLTVDYGLPVPCAAPVTINAATNTSSCYPVSWTPTGYTNPIKDWFHKYAVTKVISTDPTGGAVALSTSYRYLDGAAWHFDENELVKAKDRTYGQFRGYGRVQTRNGDGVNDRQTLSETTFYRGMSKNNNSTVVNVTDSQGGVHEDHDELAGKTLETTSYVGDGGAVDKSSITSYWVSDAAATRNRTGLSALTARRVAPVHVLNRQAITGSGATTWRLNQVDSSYDTSLTSPTYGLVKHVYTHTVPVNAAYDRCTSTTYAPPNLAANLVDLEAEVEVVSVACGGFTQGSPSSVPGAVNTLTAPTTVNRPDQVISNERTYYDVPSWSTTFPQATTPTRGDATMERSAADYTAGAYVYVTKSRSSYDSIGRIVDAYDGNGNKTNTAHTTNAVGLVTSTVITNAVGHTTSSVISPARGLTTSVTDLNGVVRTQQYDALARLSAVWLNSRATTAPANSKFTYQVSNTALSWSTTQTLNDSSGYVTETKIYDALLRTRQTQSMTPQGGRIVTDTFYDSRGWVTSKNNGWWHPATTPNTTLIAPSGVTPVPTIPNQSLFTYDGLGRVVQDHAASNNVVKSTTTNVYNGDRTTAIPPTGGIVKTTHTDPLGRTSQLDEYSVRPTLNIPADTFTGKFYVTGGTAVPLQYGFDGHDKQASVTQPGPNTWTTTHNLLGDIVRKTDPDTGAPTIDMRYDGNGNLLQVTDSMGKTLSYSYDAMNRKTGEWAATIEARTDSNRLAKWVYDNSDGAIAVMNFAKGQKTSSTAYRDGAEYKTQQNNFNIFGKSTGTSITIPAAEGGLADTYTFNHLYTTTTGLVLKDIYPAKGGLPAEAVLHGYSGVLDKPNTLGGLTGYAQGVSYDAFGRIDQATIGAGTNLGFITNTWDPHTGRLLDRLVTRSTGSPNVDQLSYDYDLVGNIKKQKQTRLGSATQVETQCYQYDNLNQLTQAWTATDDCAVTPTAADSSMVGDLLGSASAYWTSWTVDMLGWRQQVQHSTTGGGDITTDYHYNGNGDGQPHSLTSTTRTGGGSATFSYDDAGNMISRNAGNGAQSMVWDSARRLSEINGSTGGKTSFLYDADGNLLLQKDPGRTTLYLGGQELVLDTGAGTVTGKRYYVLPGGGTAIRNGTLNTAFSYALADHHGTPTLYLNNTAQTPTWRQYTPYGAPRGPQAAVPDSHGFLDKALNANTGLTQIGARNYDPLTGRFISVDPVLSTDDPQQLNAYGYGANNPNTHADPTGLRLTEDDGGTVNAAGGAGVWWLSSTIAKFRAEQKLLKQAIAARNAAAMASFNSKKTYTGTYNMTTGTFNAGVSGKDFCAEASACGSKATQSNPNTKFTKAAYWTYEPGNSKVYSTVDVPQNNVNGQASTRPKYLVEKPICAGCQSISVREQYPLGAKTSPGPGAWKDTHLARAVPYLKTAAKWGGGALFVGAVALDVYEVAVAPPEERARVATENGAGLAGALIGAKAGLMVGAAVAPFLGPFAPIAPIAGAIIGGIIGSNVGSKIGSAVADLFSW